MNAQGNSSPSTSTSFDVRTYLQVPLAYRWWILGVAAVVCGAAILWTVRQPRIYDAVCTIEYDPNPVRPLGSGIEDVADPIGSFWMNREFFETQNRIITSRSISERAVRALGLQDDPEFMDVPEDERARWTGGTVEAAALRLQGRVRVEPEERTRIVAIHVRDSDPERASRLANAVAEAYIDKTIEDRLSSTVSALNWLSEQLDSLRGELSDSEMALYEFNSTLSVSLADRQKIVSAEIEHFDTALTEARSRRIALNARVARLRGLLRDRQVDEQAAVLADVTTINGLREQLRTKLAERDGLAVRYGPAHPRMSELDAEIVGIRQQLELELTAIVHAAEADLGEVQSMERGFREALDQAQAAGLELNLREIEYERLNRQRENNAKLYNLVLQRSTETDLTRMLRVTHVRPVDRALVPSAHVSPVMTLNAAAGLLLGVFLGLTLAFGHSWLDRRIKSIEDLEQLEVAVLGALPRADEAGSRPTGRANGKRPPRAKDEQRELIAHTKPMSAFAESCRNLRTNLMFTSAERPIRTLVVTSSDPEEGKTTVATNLSVSVAQSGRRVLVIDTDLRRPRVHRAFGLSSKAGVTSIVAGMAEFDDVVQPTQVSGLDMLASGPIPPNPSELLHHPRFLDLLRMAQERYDLVVLDSPPVLAVTDASILAPQADGVLVVVKAQRTTRDAVRSTTRQLTGVGARIIGCVLNGYDPRKQGYGYGYGYGRYGGRYYAQDETDDVAPSRAVSSANGDRPSA